MDTFTKLIELGNKFADGEELKKDVKEIDSLKQGYEALPKYRNTLTPVQVELFNHDMTYPLFIQFFNIKNGTLTEFADNFIADSNKISPDISLISAYFSRYDHPVESMKAVFHDFFSPYSFFKFLHEFFESVHTLDKTMQNERDQLSSIIRSVILSTSTLVLSKDYMSLYKSLASIVKATPSADFGLFKPIIDDSFSTAVFHPLAMKSGDSLAEPVRITVLRTTGSTAAVIEAHQAKFGLMDDLFHLNTYTHQLLNEMKAHWLYTEEQNPEIFAIGRQRFFLLSQEIGALCGKANPTSTALIHLVVKWDPKFENTRLTQSSFFTVNYLGKSVVCQIIDGISELVIPIFESKPPIKITLSYILEKYDGTPLYKAKPEMFGVLHEFDVAQTDKSSVQISPFNRRKSSLSQKCGTILTTISIANPDTPAEVSAFDLSEKDLNLVQVLDFLTGKLVKTWLSCDVAMTPRPPQELHISLFELAIRYSIPAPVLYVVTLKKLADGWCQAESYLTAFAGLFLITFASVQNCKTTPAIQSMFKEIADLIKQRVPSDLLMQLSNPKKFEREAIFPLIILYSFCLPQEQLSEGLDKILKTAESNIIRTVTSALVPTPSDQPTPKQATALLSYLLQPPSGNVTFSTSTLSSTMEALILRVKELRAFYEHICVPPFLNCYQKVANTLGALALDLVNMYIAIPVQSSENEIFKFIFAYRDAWEFFSLPQELSPYKLFFPIVINWVGLVGTKLSEWTSRAVGLDTFEIANHKMMTSSSLTDLMAIFAQSFDFIGALKWKDENIAEIINTFLSICVSCLRLYTDQLTMKILAFFPREIVLEYSEGMNSLLEQITVNRVSAASQEQIYIIVNDFVALNSNWNSFIEAIKPKIEPHKVDSRFLNPIPDVVRVSKAIPPLFAGLISNEILSKISERLWVRNNAAKMLFSRKASSLILNPEFVDRRSDYFVTLFESTIALMKARIDSLDSRISIAFKKKMISAFIRGLDTGLVNLCILGDPHEPIKAKRLQPLLQFMQEVLGNIFEYLRTKDTPLTGAEYSEVACKCKFITDNSGKSTSELISMDDGKGDFDRSMIIYILIRARTYEKEAAKWASENSYRFTHRKFRPVENK